MTPYGILKGIIQLSDTWKDKVSSNPGTVAIGSGFVGGLSSYVRGGVESGANWKSRPKMKGAVAGGAVAGLGGYLISKGLKTKASTQERLVERFGRGHQNSFSARDELDSILNFKEGGDYKRHWSQKKKPKGKPLSKKQQAEEDEQHQMSAREQLDEITFARGDLLRRSSYGGAFAKDYLEKAIAGRGSEEAKVVGQSVKASLENLRRVKSTPKVASSKPSQASTSSASSQGYNWPLIGAVAGAPLAAGAGIYAMTRKRPEDRELSAREELEVILFGADAHGRLHNAAGMFGSEAEGVAHPQQMAMVYGSRAAKTESGGALKALIERLKRMKK